MTSFTSLLTRLVPASSEHQEPASTVLLLSEEPYLEFLLRRASGDIDVQRPDRGMPVAAMLASRPDVVIGDEDDPRLAELAEHADVRSVAIVDRRRRVALRARSWDAELSKPFAEADVARALGVPVRREVEPARGPLQNTLRLLPGLRLATVALAAILELLGGGGGGARAALLALAFAWATSRAVLGRLATWALAIDVVVALLLIGATDGIDSSYLLVAVLVAVQVGLALGWLRGLAVGAALSVASLLGSALMGGLPTAGAEIALSTLLFPVAGFTAGLGAGLARERHIGAERILVGANRMLRELQDFSRSVPGGLELATVAQAVVDELRDETAAAAAVLLVHSGDLLSAAAATGLGGTPTILIDDDDPVFERARRGRLHRIDTTVLDDDAAGALRVYDTWLVEPLRWSGGTVGLLLAAVSDEREAEVRQRMQGLVPEAAVAIENALLYRDLRSVTVDEERRRLAAEMHDGLAQVLAHLRFELDMLATGTVPADEVHAEAARLARVAERALGEARSTITGLRASVATAGLAATLRDYVRDLRGLAGTGIELEITTADRLLPEVEREVFRIAQEAISNALRHARAQRVSVRFVRHGPDLVLRVEDDGIGFDPGDPRSYGSGGLGLVDLRERAERSGCELDVVSTTGGGTHVEVRCPERLQVPQVPEGEPA